MTFKDSWLKWPSLLLAGVVLVGPFVPDGWGSLVQGPEQRWRDWFTPAAIGFAVALMFLFWFLRPLRDVVEDLLQWPDWGWYWSKRSIRLGLGIPLVALICAFWLVFLIQAYVDMFAYWVGTPRAGVPATVLEVVARSGKGCKLMMTLRLGDAHEEVCVEDRVMGPIPAAGQTVWLQGVDSFAGFWVSKIHTGSMLVQPPTSDKSSCPMILLVCPS